MWKKLISELEASGMKQGEIGKAVGLTQGAISQIKNIEGRQPTYRAGTLLVRLHERTVKRAEGSGQAKQLLLSLNKGTASPSAQA